MSKKETEPTLVWFFRVLNLAVPGAVIGAAVGSVVPVLGTAVGGAIGGIFGGFIGYIYPLFKKENKEEKEEEKEDEREKEDGEDANPVEEWPEKQWFRPSATKAFTWDTRFYFGAGAGALIGGAIGSFVPVIGTLIGAGIGAAIGGSLAAAYPSLAKPFISTKMTSIAKPKAWNKETTYDVPLYVRAFVGASIGMTIGTIIGTVVPGIGNILGGAAGALIGTAIVIAVPSITAGIRKLFSKNDVKENDEADIDLIEKEPEAPKRSRWYQESSMDIPLYGHFLAGMMGGAILGGAIGTVVPVIGNFIGMAVGAAVGATLAIASPSVFAGINKLFSSKKVVEEEYKPSDKEQNSLDIPWQIRFFAGSVGGAALGAAIGSVVPIIGTAIGGLVGASLGTVLALSTPPADVLYNKIPSFFEKSAEPGIPWYMRMVAGSIGGATLGAAVGTLFPGIGTAIGGAFGTFIGAGICIISPPLFDKILKGAMKLKARFKKTPEPATSSSVEVGDTNGVYLNVQPASPPISMPPQAQGAYITVFNSVPESDVMKQIGVLPNDNKNNFSVSSSAPG